MRAKISHIGLNVSQAGKSFAFWKDLLTHLGFTIVPDGNHFDATNGESYLCMQVTDPAHADTGYHRKQTGLSHIAFQAESPSEIDEFVSGYLGPRGITPLYGGAREYPEYVPGYYAVYFEDPDRIKIELAYEP